ncbi:MAG: alkaline phosphatase D family protein [Verrucomicrobiaceae bacterium]|nr:alkaline phosphatase D family protein [Verrucomicrobiaceae bacterium]
MQVILLDTRYFRSALKKVAKDKAMLGGTSVPTDDESTTILGAAQWAWLAKVLQEPAELRIVVSSIQFAPEAHGGECWANFPHEQRRLRSLLKGQKAVVLSGDRHWCEFSKNGVHDFTSSSMTQKHPRGTPTANKHRTVPKTYHLPNVGLLSIDWVARSVRAQIIAEDGSVKIEHSVGMDALVCE